METQQPDPPLPSWRRTLGSGLAAGIVAGSISTMLLVLFNSLDNSPRFLNPPVVMAAGTILGLLTGAAWRIIAARSRQPAYVLFVIVGVTATVLSFASVLLETQAGQPAGFGRGFAVSSFVLWFGAAIVFGFLLPRLAPAPSHPGPRPGTIPFTPRQE